MPEIRKKYDREFRDGAVRIVEETKKPIAQVARDLGVNEGTLGNWVNRAKEAREGTQGLSTGDIAELKRLRALAPVLTGITAVADPLRVLDRARRNMPGRYREAIGLAALILTGRPGRRDGGRAVSRERPGRRAARVPQGSGR